jgi:hypothetical protein
MVKPSSKLNTNKDIVFKKLQQGETERIPLSIGNDLKAAATDC